MENKNIMKAIEKMLQGVSKSPKKVASITVVFKNDKGEEVENELEDEEMDEEKEGK